MTTATKTNPDRAGAALSILDCDVMEDKAMTYPEGPCRADLVTTIGRLRSTLEELATLQQRLEARKVIERAKGVLMKRFRWAESEAFRRLQRGAMDRRMPMAELAKMVIEGKDVEW